MKKLLSFLCFLGILYPCLGHDIPTFSNYIVDQTNTLGVQELEHMNAMLKAYEDSTSTQIAVLLIPAYDDQAGQGTLFDFSMKVFKSWKIGQSEQDNGVLLVITKHLASKNAPGIRITTGRGAEENLPDAVCKRIIEKMRPSINNGDYYHGITASLTDMMTALRGAYQAETEKPSSGTSNEALLIILIIVAIIIIIIWASSRHRSGSYSSGSSDSSFFSFGSGGSSSSGDSDSSFGGGGGGDSGGGGAGD